MQADTGDEDGQQDESNVSAERSSVHNEPTGAPSKGSFCTHRHTHLRIAMDEYLSLDYLKVAFAL